MFKVFPQLKQSSRFSWLRKGSYKHFVNGKELQGHNEDDISQTRSRASCIVSVGNYSSNQANGRIFHKGNKTGLISCKTNTSFCSSIKLMKRDRGYITERERERELFVAMSSIQNPILAQVRRSYLLLLGFKALRV